jgi:hypothetical protein
MAISNAFLGWSWPSS